MTPLRWHLTKKKGMQMTEKNEACKAGKEKKLTNEMIQFLIGHLEQIQDELTDWLIMDGKDWPFFYSLPVLDDDGEPTGETATITLTRFQYVSVLKARDYYKDEG